MRQSKLRNMDPRVKSSVHQEFEERVYLKRQKGASFSKGDRKCL